jgi:hypothetical protein
MTDLEFRHIKNFLELRRECIEEKRKNNDPEKIAKLNVRIGRIERRLQERA